MFEYESPREAQFRMGKFAAHWALVGALLVSLVTAKVSFVTRHDSVWIGGHTKDQ